MDFQNKSTKSVVLRSFHHLRHEIVTGYTFKMVFVVSDCLGLIICLAVLLLGLLPYKIITEFNFKLPVRADSNVQCLFFLLH